MKKIRYFSIIVIYLMNFSFFFKFVIILFFTSQVTIRVAMRPTDDSKIKETFTIEGHATVGSHHEKIDNLKFTVVKEPDQVEGSVRQIYISYSTCSLYAPIYKYRPSHRNIL